MPASNHPLGDHWSPSVGGLLSGDPVTRYLSSVTAGAVLTRRPASTPELDGQASVVVVPGVYPRLVCAEIRALTTSLPAGDETDATAASPMGAIDPSTP